VRRVVLESPYAGDVKANIKYARECVLDSLRRGEAPIASHLLYTQPGVLDDNNAGQRANGLLAGWAWIAAADALVVYQDRGVSDGMREAIQHAELAGVYVEYRFLREPAQ